MPARPTAAIVVYQGVLVDEAEVFRFVLSRIPNVQAVTVGTSPGPQPGPGGEVIAESTLGDLTGPAIVAIPGGLGCHRHTEIAHWLRTVSPEWTLTSSTGSALLAAAGMLRDATAATHWLAGSLLERYGAHPSDEQVVVDGRMVTCAGASSAFRAALVIADAYGGADVVDRIRAEAAAYHSPEPPHRAIWRRLWDSARRLTGHRVHTSPSEPSAEQGVLDLGLITPPDRNTATQRFRDHQR